MISGLICGYTKNFPGGGAEDAVAGEEMTTV
jgi:hypothetical protein